MEFNTGIKAFWHTKYTIIIYVNKNCVNTFIATIQHQYKNNIQDGSQSPTFCTVLSLFLSFCFLRPKRKRELEHKITASAYSLSL